MQITNSALARQIRERCRPRAETIYGLGQILRDDIAAMQAVSVPADGSVIDDGAESPIPFIGLHWHGLLALAQGLVAGGEQIGMALQSLIVRPLDLIVSHLVRSGESQIADPAARILVNRIRPRAKQIRSLRYIFNDDCRILTPLINAEWADSDIIDEERQDNIPSPTVGAIRALLAFEASVIGVGTNTEAVAQAIDAACGGIPLEVS